MWEKNRGCAPNSPGGALSKKYALWWQRANVQNVSRSPYTLKLKSKTKTCVILLSFLAYLEALLSLKDHVVRLQHHPWLLYLLGILEVLSGLALLIMKSACEWHCTENYNKFHFYKAMKVSNSYWQSLSPVCTLPTTYYPLMWSHVIWALAINRERKVKSGK